jgi:hypothetical protein
MNYPQPLIEKWNEIERSHFWKLDQSLRTELESLSHVDGLPLVEGWTFVPHPNVVKHLAGEDFSHHIVLLDTMSSEVYDHVYRFLKEQKNNCSSFYTGGSADFVCNVRMSAKQFGVWEQELKEVLRRAGATNYNRTPNGVREFYSVFRIESTLITCGKIVSDLAALPTAVTRRIETERVLFELCWRNYRSPEAIEAAGGPDRLAEKLDEWQRQGAIMCFGITADLARYWATDYVVLRIRDSAVEGLISLAREDDGRFFSPIDEMYSIEVRWTPEKTDRGLNLLFVNNYSIPGERIEWKKAIYKWAHQPDTNTQGGALDVNLYNYPLEAALNETSTWISDIPEFLQRCQAYEKASGPKIEYGTAMHPIIKVGLPKIPLPVSGLPFHGVTFGAPGTGKTNTDLILSTGVLDYLHSTIIFDAGAGSWGKLTDQLRSKAHRLQFESPAEVPDILSRAMGTKGLVVLESPKELLLEAVQCLIAHLSSAPELAPSSGEKRRISHFAMIEEAHNIWTKGGSGVEAVQRGLLSILDESWRKGWSIWLSTQDPKQLGLTADFRETLQGKLKNRIVHSMEDKAHVDSFVGVLENEGHSDEDIEYVRENISRTGKGLALLRMVTLADDNKPTLLPPVLATVPLLGQL